MSNSKYYYDNNPYFNKDKYKTLWNGYLAYKIDDTYISDERQLNDILVDVCERNFYITLQENYIYLSFDSDEYLYHYQFEKMIKPSINKIQENFKIFIEEGEFYATEIKHCGNQYKYTINQSINHDNEKKITIKKKTMNWENYEKAKISKKK